MINLGSDDSQGTFILPSHLELTEFRNAGPHSQDELFKYEIILVYSVESQVLER